MDKYSRKNTGQAKAVIKKVIFSGFRKKTLQKYNVGVSI